MLVRAIKECARSELGCGVQAESNAPSPSGMRSYRFDAGCKVRRAARADVNHMLGRKDGDVWYVVRCPRDETDEDRDGHSNR